MTNFLSIVFATALVNNIILVQFLGVSSLFAYSNNLRNAIELALFSFVVLIVTSVINLLLFRFILHPLNLDFLNLIIFVLVSAAITSVLIHWLSRSLPLSLRRQSLEFYLLAGNGAIIGVSLSNTVNTLSLLQSVAYIFGAGLGFALLLVGFAALRQRLDYADIPAAFRGAPIHLISAGIVAMCLLGFAGLA